ncbi:aspartic peptidase domain-containing protein [Phyllosticta capitalensis]|uniref:Aspartic peptidase domain-containing protein n=1 Tax=Phyllosticta capitalensis TaxID=121624 RepID=A0ABR1YLG0_9PEZI
MPSYSTAALVALVGTSLASPVARHEFQKRDTYSFRQVQRGTYTKNGPAQVAKAYKKFGVSVPSVVNAAVSAAAAATTGSVEATPEDNMDSLYLCPVNVGGTELQLDFDTGSADLWVFSSQMTSSEQTGHAIYKPSSSATKKNGYSWDISYGDGSGAAGNVYADKVVVGGVTATSQAVEAATSVSSSFTSDTDNDGLLGLAFSSINTVSPQAQNTFFDTVADQLAKKLFAVTLKKGEAGTYDFGYIDQSKYTGEIAYIDVDSSEGYWGFTADGYAVGDGSVTGSSFSAIADTGTTLVYLPDEIVDAYYAKVDGASYDEQQAGYTFACSTDLPDFSLSLGGAKRTVPGNYINYAKVDGNNCYGGIQSSSSIGLSIVGDIFLKSQYVVFDKTQSTPRLGWAQQSSTSSSSSNGTASSQTKGSSSASAPAATSPTPTPSPASTGSGGGFGGSGIFPSGLPSGFPSFGGGSSGSSSSQGSGFSESQSSGSSSSSSGFSQEAANQAFNEALAAAQAGGF